MAETKILLKGYSHENPFNLSKSPWPHLNEKFIGKSFSDAAQESLQTFKSGLWLSN
jgi:hypothetical protein